MLIGLDAPAPLTFEKFYASTSRRTLALAYALTGNWGDAEDLVQEAFGAAHRQWARVAAYDDPSAWVRRLVLNRAVSRWRRLHREAAALVRLNARQADAVPPSSQLIDPEFWAAVRRLPAEQARAVALYYVEDMSVEEIAMQMGCSTGTVKTHLSRGRVALAVRLGMKDNRHV